LQEGQRKPASSWAFTRGFCLGLLWAWCLAGGCFIALTIAGLMPLGSPGKPLKPHQFAIPNGNESGHCGKVQARAVTIRHLIVATVHVFPASKAF
jgi:hypothetical protein